MKNLVAGAGIAIALLVGAPPPAFAQEAPSPAPSGPPPLPQLTPQQSADVQQRIDDYRTRTQGRVARGEITPDEAERLIGWREWQLARQAAGQAPSAPMVYDSPPPDYVVVAPRPYYGPYYYPSPYYWGPRRYYWGPTICAGGFGHHVAGSFCF